MGGIKLYLLNIKIRSGWMIHENIKIVTSHRFTIIEGFSTLA